MTQRKPEVDVDLYLMQHGTALSEEEDPQRPLSDAGRAGVERVATAAQVSGVRIERIIHSGKLRAEQSAQLLAAALGVGDVAAQEGLNPSDDVAAFADSLARTSAAGSLAVVGHLPFLDRLASLLVAGDAGAQAVRFSNGGLVKLVPKKDVAGSSVAWALVPEIT